MPLLSCSLFKDEKPSGKTETAGETGTAADPSAVAKTPAEGGAPQRPTTASPSATVRGTGAFIDPAAAARPAPVRIEKGEVTLNFVDTDVRDVVRSVLGKTLGLNYAIDPKVKGPVTLETARPIAMESVLSTLETVLQANGVAIVEDGGIYKVVPAALAAHGAVPRLPRGLRGRRNAFAVQIVPLKFASAREMSKILEPLLRKGAILRVDEARNLLIVAGTRAERASVNEIVDIFDVDWFKGMSFALVPLRFSKAKDVAADVSNVFGDTAKGPLAGLLKFIALERMNSVLVISSNPAYIDKSRTWIERFDVGDQSDERRLYVYNVENGRAADLADALNKIFTGQGSAAPAAGGLAPGLQPAQISSPSLSGQRTTTRQSGTQTSQAPATGGTTAQTTSATASTQPPGGSPPSGAALLAESDIRIFAVEATNSLVIMATPNEYRQVESALRQLDVIPLQVLISATIAEVSLNDTLQYGVQWFFDSGATEITLSDVASGAVASAFPGLSVLFSSGSDVRAVVNALQEVTDVNVISSPQLMVLDNRTAELQVGDQVPVTTGSTVDGTTIANSIQLRDTGVVLRVTPRVNASGLVILEIEQEVSDVIETTSSTLNSPTIQQRRIKSSVAVQSGDTVALGGLIRTKNTETKSGIPLLSQIPILGALFGSTNNVVERTELLVLIRPRVVRNQKEARDVTEELRKRIKIITTQER